MNGTNVGGLYYTITLDTAELIRKERDAARSLDRVGKRADALQAQMTKVAAAVSAALAAITVDALVGKLVTVQRQFDVMFASLKTVTGGTEAANREFERLQRFATTTPYSLDQTVKGFVKLKALGLDPSERSMQSFGNTASAMGKDLNQMIEAVADAATGEFERLKEFGIRARQQGDQVTFTFRGISTTVRNSADEITEYLTRIGEVEFAGAMSERMKTLDGDISNLADAWDQLFLTISRSGVGDAVAAGVRKATEAITEASISIREGELTEYFDKLKPLIAATEVVAVALAGTIAGRLVTAFVAAAAQAYATATAMGAATVAARGFTAVLAAMGGPVGIAVTGLALLALNWDKIASSAKSAAEISEDAGARIQGALAKGGKAATRELNAQLSEAKRTLGAIDAAIASLGAAASPEDAGASGILPDRARLNADRDRVLATIADIEAARRRLSTQADAQAIAEQQPGSWGGEASRRAAAPPPPPNKDAQAAAKRAAEARTRGYLEQLAEEQKIRDEQDAATQKFYADQQARRDRDAEEARRAAIERARGQGTALSIIALGDPIATLRLQLEQQSAMLDEFARADLENAALYEDAKVALKEETARRIAKIEDDERNAQLQRNAQSLQIMGSFTGELLSLLKQAGKERTALAKAVFLAERALAVATIIMNTEVAASKATGQLGIFGLPMAQIIRAAGYASAGLVAGQALGEAFGGGRQYGGRTMAGTMYPVNESGRPEMFVADNGSQFMLPTRDGRVEPNLGRGPAAAPTVVIQNMGSPLQVTEQRFDREANTVTLVVSHLVESIQTNRGPFMSALKNHTNVRASQ